MKERIQILMTGAGAPGAPGILHCLKQDPRFRIIVADADPMATGRFLADDFVQIPAADDPGFITTLLNVCQQKNIRLVMPLVTRELFLFSAHKKDFESIGVNLLVSSEEAIHLSNNKSNCYQLLQSKGMKLPAFHVVNNLEAFIHAAFELGHPGRPFCFKPSVSNGSRGVRVVSDSLDEHHQLFQEKPYTLDITYSHALHILSSKPFPELLVSEYLPGEEYSVDCIASQGEAITVVPRLRKKMINGISVQGSFVKDDAIIDQCKQIIELIQLHGNIGIQLKRSVTGEALLLEINPRVQGTIVSALGAGINLPLLAVKMELGEPIRPDELEVKWGTSFSRYWTEVYY
ncbi:MAG: ATP-grasp domain-containing protein [Flavisolibacter sp.]